MTVGWASFFPSTCFTGEQDAHPPADGEMTMNAQIKIYIVAAVAVIFAIGLLSYALSNRKIAKLESEVAAAKTVAHEKEKAATAKEIEAAAYIQKIDYLEARLAEIKQLARKQDEQLETINNDSRTARGNADRARRTRTITANAAELCQKLAELGHPCR